MPKIGTIAVFLFIFLDRIAKWYILIHPSLYLGDFIELKLFRNEKLFFLSFGEYTNLIVSLISILILALLLVWVFRAMRKKNLFLTFSLFLIIFGGLSNLFDRIYYGFVVDFIWFKILPISVFNIADIMITFGIICLIFSLRKYK